MTKGAQLHSPSSDLQLADCMRNLLGAVDPGDLRKLLERSAEEAHEAAMLADQDAIGTSTEIYSCVVFNLGCLALLVTKESKLY